MDRGLHTIGAKGFTGLRALFCLCLLFFATVPATEPTRTKPGATAPDGMTAPPTPLLEPQSRFGTFGGLERRFLGALPVADGLWIAAYSYQVLPLPLFNQPNPRPRARAQTPPWRREGG